MPNKNINLSHARSGEQREIMEQIQKDGVCPFCNPNLKRYHKKPLLKKTKYWIVTENQHPYEGSRHHWLAISTSHIEHLDQISSGAMDDLTKIFCELCEKNSLKGGALVMRFGDTNLTGATVSHLHAHLIVGGEKNTEPLKVKVGYKQK